MAEMGGGGTQLLAARRAVLCAVVMACAVGCKDVRWREEQEILIGVAVLADLAAEEADSQRGRPTDVCVSVSEGVEAPPRNPDEKLLAALRSRLPGVYPASDCRVTADGVTRTVTGGRAVILGVAPPIWRSDDFVTVKGWRIAGTFDATSWTYTLNRDGRDWKIGAVKAGQIAALKVWCGLDPPA